MNSDTWQVKNPSELEKLFLYKDLARFSSSGFHPVQPNRAAACGENCMKKMQGKNTENALWSKNPADN